MKLVEMNVKFYYFALLLFAWFVVSSGLAVFKIDLLFLTLPWIFIAPLAFVGLILKKRWGLYLAIIGLFLNVLVNLGLIGLGLSLNNLVYSELNSGVAVQGFNPQQYLSMYSESIVDAIINLGLSVLTLCLLYFSKGIFGIKIVQKSEDFKYDWEKEQV